MGHETKGGEALPFEVEMQDAVLTVAETGGVTGTEPAWYALWTRSHCEQLVYDQLTAKGFRLSLPRIDIWSRRGGLRHLTRSPIFAGYLFLHHAMDKMSYIEIRKARGLVRVLGERWDRLPAIPPAEIAAIHRIADARVPALPHPYLREGQRVRIRRGPLADVEGILIRTKPSKGLLVVSVDLLQRSVAVEVDCTSVTPA
jgi:transcription termination/antitermination protein NusG